MRIKLAAACAALSIIIGSGLAVAASSTTTKAIPGSTTTTATDPAAMAEADKAFVPVWPKSTVALPTDQQPVATTFSLGAVEGVKPELVAGVTANGYARKVAVENQVIGQVLVLEVSKGGKTEAISAEGLTAQFDASQTSELFPEKSLTVEGSKAALVAALEKLAATENKDEEKKVERDATSENSVGSNASSNDAASSYKTPTATTLAATEEDPTITYETTTSGCKVRVDLTQEKAFQQNKTQTFSDGVLSSETECTDSEISFPIKKSYLSCPDTLDVSAMTAWPQFTYYYADDVGETHTVSECTKDEESPYTITEDEGQCSIDLDFEAATATPQSALIYINRSGATVQARGCATSTLSTPIPMTESTAACPLRHDYAVGKSYELSLWTYVRGGVTYQAAPCTETGRSFQHETIYTDTAGEYVCTPIVNQSAGTVTLQSRKRITIDGVNQYVTECTPDTSTQAILATTEGCMDPSKWTHDVAAGVSYGQERFYYLKGSTPVYVTACQTSAVSYPHDQAITGYQYHDDALYAYPLSTVTITVSGSKYTVKSSEVLPGAQQIVYVPATPATIDKQNGAATYEGCNAYYTTIRYEQWERPDDTTYEKAIGDGAPVGPADVCSTTTETSDYLWDRGTIPFVYVGWGCDSEGRCGQYESVQGGNTVTQYFISRTVRINPNTGETFTGNAITTGSVASSTQCNGGRSEGYSRDGSWVTTGIPAPSGYSGPHYKSGPTWSTAYQAVGGAYGYWAWDATCWRGTSYSWSGTSTMPGR